MNRPGDSEEQKRLQAAFDWIKDPRDWRAPIDRVVDGTDPRFLDAFLACEHFTATKLQAEHMERTLFRVRADGYRNGPAGP